MVPLMVAKNEGSESESERLHLPNQRLDMVPCNSPGTVCPEISRKDVEILPERLRLPRSHRTVDS